MEKNTSNSLEHQGKHSPSDNIYENTVLVAKRAKQIMMKRRGEVQDELEKFEVEEDSLVATLHHASYKEKIARAQERLPKPIVAAKKDVEEGRIIYSYVKKNFID